MQTGWDGMLLQDAVVAMLVHSAFSFEKIPNSVTSKAASEHASQWEPCM